MLEDAGYQVCEAANGRQGLERFHTQPVDLVITDLEMPEMNGLEVSLELTRAFLDVEVIAMSGRSNRRIIESQAPRGAADLCEAARSPFIAARGTV